MCNGTGTTQEVTRDPFTTPTQLSISIESAKALKRIGGAEAEAALIGTIERKHKVDSVCEIGAAVYLSRKGIPEAKKENVEVLIRLCLHEPAKQEIMKRLTQIGNEKIPVLTDLLNDDSIGRFAAEALSQANYNESVPSFVDFMARQSDHKNIFAL